jgi:hypothetical protein
VACGANLRPPGSPGTRVPCTTTTRGTLEPEKDYVDPKLGLSHEFAGLPLMPRVSASVHYSPGFSPSTELRRWFGHDPDKWDEFRRRYQKELKDNNDLIKLLRRNHGR